MLQRQIVMRKTDEYLMQLSIIANPHKDPADGKEFVDDLLQRRRFYRGETEAPEKLDVAAFEKLRKAVQTDSNVIKAK